MSRRAIVLLGAAGGAALGALVAAGARIYQERTLERTPSLEGIDSPEASAAYGRIASLPQMRLLHGIAIRRALALAGGDHAIGQAIDLGCGAGQLAVELAQAAPAMRVTGFDLSTELLTEAHRRVLSGDLAHRVDFRNGDAQEVPLGDAKADLVISTLSLHHWSDPLPVLDEIARILRPGGAFVVFDLRRDMIPPFYLLIWFAARYVVPKALRYIGEPLGSRNAAYTPAEAAQLAQASRLTGWRVAQGPFWLTIEGTKSR